MNGDPRYSAPNARTYPPVTRVAILPFYHRLVRAFGGIEDMPEGVAEGRGGRPIRSNRSKARTCWASTKPTTGHGKGWGRMIHDASHYVFEKRHPHARPHDGGHATLEREMAEYAAAKLLPRFEAARTAIKVRKGRPSYEERIAHCKLLFRAWDAKQRRAANAMKKLARRIRALERSARIVTPVTDANVNAA